MLTKAQCHLLITWCLLFCSVDNVVIGASTPLSIQLYPTDVKVNVGGWATFICSMPCNLTLTNTMSWFVGESPNAGRRVDSNFEQRTGIKVWKQDVSVCGISNTVKMQEIELSILAESIEKMNKTAVQCGALRKQPSIPDLFSHYGVMVVYGEGNGHSDPEPSATEPPLVITSTKTVTVTITQSVQATNLPLPNFSPAKLSRDSGSSRERASLLWTLTQAILVSFVLLALQL